MKPLSNLSHTKQITQKLWQGCHFFNMQPSNSSQSYDISAHTSPPSAWEDLFPLNERKKQENSFRKQVYFPQKTLTFLVPFATALHPYRFLSRA